ncbi:MAG: hypothetical protein P8P36_06265 [Akkermansiaceae bacterium]|nr:hypothetical protein [Akkermansiaceae bacterium]
MICFRPAAYLFCFLLCFAASSLADGKRVNNSIAYYLDSRDYNTLSVNTAAQLPWDFKLWGFTDFNGDQNEGNRYDLERFFMEYRLLHEIPEERIFGLKGVGLLTEFNNFNGSDNDLFRFGPYISRKIELPWGKEASLQLRMYPYQTDSDNRQLSLSYFIPFSEKLSLSGFADINFIDGGSDQWVIEPQLNYKLNDSMNLLLEYRYNGFESSNPNLKGSGVALGMSIEF